VIIEFDDKCWTRLDEDWKRSLIELLVPLVSCEQHFIHATIDSMVAWCSENLPLYVDYFKTRLATAQHRINSLNILISPDGAATVDQNPPWSLTALAARKLVVRPLRLVFENDNSDQAFVTSVVTSFATWCQRGWIAPDMGGGAAMERDIETSAADPAARWRTFYMFDSDRLHPSELSIDWRPPNGDGCQGFRFEVACAAMPQTRWHRLNRRSIENYLPQVVLDAVDVSATSVLFGSSVGSMANHYNLKRGLAGDGVLPQDPGKVVRASRSQGFWNALPPEESSVLERGFGRDISNQFTNVPKGHGWPLDVVAEMDALAVALQDAM